MLRRPKENNQFEDLKKIINEYRNEMVKLVSNKNGENNNYTPDPRLMNIPPAYFNPNGNNFDIYSVHRRQKSIYIF